MGRFESLSPANSISVLVALGALFAVALGGIAAVDRYGIGGLGILAVLVAGAVVGALLLTYAFRALFVAAAYLVGYLRKAVLSVRYRR
ncbi:MAG: hypothetical protein ABEJ28_04375 [Salinigranum sp.]